MLSFNRQRFDLIPSTSTIGYHQDERKRPRRNVTAAEAKIEMPDGGCVDRHAPFVERAHEMNPAARRIHFRSQLQVSRAGGKTEAAMDAIEDLFHVRRVELVDGVRVHHGDDIQGLPVYAGGLSWFDLDEEGHQRYPGDYETQVGQGPVTLHSEEHLASSDRGVSMVRRQFKEQVRRVADGLDPAGVAFDPAEAVQDLIAGNYIVGPDTDLSAIPVSESLR